MAVAAGGSLPFQRAFFRTTSIWTSSPGSRGEDFLGALDGWSSRARVAQLGSKDVDMDTLLNELDIARKQ